MTTINLGKVRPVDRGEWNEEGTYTILDIVTSNYGSYMSKVGDTETPNTAPLTDRASWIPLADVVALDAAIQEANNSISQLAGDVRGGKIVLFNAPSADMRNGYYEYDSYMWVDSMAGYKTSPLLEVTATKVYTDAYAGATVYAIVFFDEYENVIGGVKGFGLVTEYNIPENAIYYTVTGLINTTYTTFEYYYNKSSISDQIDAIGVDLLAVKSDVATLSQDVSISLKESDLSTIIGVNLANPINIISDFYVNNSGAIANAAGWKMIIVDVSSMIGDIITFGNFIVDTAGYSAFYDSTFIPSQAGSPGMITYNGMFTGLPRNYVVPANSKWLAITIARPINQESDYSLIMINAGASLLPYEPYTSIVTSINGHEIKSGGEPYDQSLNTTDSVEFAEIATSSIVLNLPTSNIGLVAGRAWIDTANYNVIKVV